ncbi:MAG: DUF202 domain-containing protein [Xanthomonadaceae bacterium]|nr:DUF202 domain-containing protein [Xanthomonadaceae bacterium]MDE1961563.1 DUF202 domain-containing protein [Xanthomonadaceae bacterium]MDE2083388.1 DUF202 domain-containing protein [Xanthomonadaceae bacterium]MDE2258180.1 DUF202 domain-containing protein [Xanthomonadaceae bacterium]
MDSTTTNDPRVYMAAERTFLAWVRTGVALMGFGFVVARFGLFLQVLTAEAAPVTQPRHALSLPIGVTLVVLGIVVTIAAALRHAHYVRALHIGAFTSRPHSRLPVIISAALALVGVSMAVYLALL